MTAAISSLAACGSCLEQAIDLLDRLNDHQYASRRGDWSPVGAQFRHIVEHYQCLLTGLPNGTVDYDARRRDPTLEISRSHARALTLALRAELAAAEPVPLSRRLAVQMRTNPDIDHPEWTDSTFGRELQFLVSHTVHHFALIKLLVAGDSLELPAEFGMAPSTLAHVRHAS